MKTHVDGCTCDKCFQKWQKGRAKRSLVEQRVLFRAGEDKIAKAYNDFGDCIAGMQKDCPELFQDLIDQGLIQVNQEK